VHNSSQAIQTVERIELSEEHIAVLPVIWVALFFITYGCPLETEARFYMLKLLSICALLPLVFYDVVTSIGGGFAVFGISDYNSASSLLGAFPIALAIGATALNFWTGQIWAEGSSLAVIRLAWFLFILFDLYTTLLGVVGFMTGGGTWFFPHRTLEQAFNALGQEKSLFAIGASLIVTLSPMTCNMIYHHK
jgi:hypothetical protein